jgi:hypothetical protein
MTSQDQVEGAIVLPHFVYPTNSMPEKPLDIYENMANQHPGGNFGHLFS